MSLLFLLRVNDAILSVLLLYTLVLVSCICRWALQLSVHFSKELFCLNLVLGISTKFLLCYLGLIAGSHKIIQHELLLMLRIIMLVWRCRLTPKFFRLSKSNCLLTPKNRLLLAWSIKLRRDAAWISFSWVYVNYDFLRR